MRTSFVADQVTVERREHSVLHFLASSAAAPRPYVSVTRSPLLASKPYGDLHFEWCGQGYGAYDVIRTCELSEHGVRFTLSENALEDFDGELTYDVSWSLPHDAQRRVYKGLRRLFRCTMILKVVR